jgi:hypothetical protein
MFEYMARMKKKCVSISETTHVQNLTRLHCFYVCDLKGLKEKYGCFLQPLANFLYCIFGEDLAENFVPSADRFSPWLKICKANCYLQDQHDNR